MFLAPLLRKVHPKGYSEFCGSLFDYDRHQTLVNSFHSHFFYFIYLHYSCIYLFLFLFVLVL